jgi:excisionase family DNA binding protein
MRIMTVKEVAAFLKLKEATVCSLASDGKLPGFKLGKSWRFDMDEVEQWIAGMPRNGMGDERSACELRGTGKGSLK